MKQSGHNQIRVLAWLLAICAAVLCAGCAQKTETPASREPQAIIEEMVVDYGNNGAEAEPHVAALLSELRAADADAGERWERIMERWKTVNTDMPVNNGVLPDGLPDTDELCIVVLGFRLNPDGTMQDELIERLRVAARSAEKYPHALIVCTGGGTATENETATEAGKMAEWLTENGIAPERVIVEDKSASTVQNAIYTLDILSARYPQVRELAIVSSDYHISTGTLLFEAEAILRPERADAQTLHVVSNAAWPAPSGMQSTMRQAGGLLELSGNKDAAVKIYRGMNNAPAPPPQH